MKSKCTCPDPKDAWPWITWHCNEEVDRCQGGLLHHPKQKEEPSHEAIIRCEKGMWKIDQRIDCPDPTKIWSGFNFEKNSTTNDRFRGYCFACPTDPDQNCSYENVTIECEMGKWTFNQPCME